MMLTVNLICIKVELQSRMTSQMNDGLANWERDRRVNSCPDYEEKQLLALNGMFCNRFIVLNTENRVYYARDRFVNSNLIRALL